LHASCSSAPGAVTSWRAIASKHHMWCPITNWAEAKEADDQTAKVRPLGHPVRDHASIHGAEHIEHTNPMNKGGLSQGGGGGRASTRTVQSYPILATIRSPGGKMSTPTQPKRVGLRLSTADGCTTLQPSDGGVRHQGLKGGKAHPDQNSKNLTLNSLTFFNLRLAQYTNGTRI
jgi:hypothetical protein